jgi:hypothetical protein
MIGRRPLQGHPSITRAARNTEGGWSTLWRQRYGRRRQTFTRFEDFVIMHPLEGLGTDMAMLRRLTQGLASPALHLGVLFADLMPLCWPLRSSEPPSSRRTILPAILISIIVS